MKINFFISIFFYKIGYLIITPKTYSFGGFYDTLIDGLKLSSVKKKTPILCISLINFQNNFKEKILYNLTVLFFFFKNSKIDQKLIIFFLSILINIFHLIYFIKIDKLINKLFVKNNFFLNFVPTYLGYRKNETKCKFSKLMKVSYDELANSKFKFNYKFEETDSKRFVAFCIKDTNYQKFRDISVGFASNIEKNKKVINYLISNQYKVFRVGEPMMNNFNFNHKNYKDYCYVKSHQKYLNSLISNCDFYFGSAASHGSAAALYNKNRILINCIEHVLNPVSYTRNNFVIFKPIFSKKFNKILSIEEVFAFKLFDFTSVANALSAREIVLIENSEEEILETVKNFLFSKKSIVQPGPLLTEYENIKSATLKKINKLKLQNTYDLNDVFSVPESYLKKYLFNNTYLDCLTKIFLDRNLK